MLAFHNDAALKSAIVTELEAHRAADNIIHGMYWENGKGCAVGCTIQSIGIVKGVPGLNHGKQPHKSSSHALSAKAVANNMGIWRMAREAEARQPIRSEPVTEGKSQ